MTAATAKRAQRTVRLLLRRHQPELAAEFNRAVRTLACGPDCRLHPHRDPSGPGLRDWEPMLPVMGANHQTGG